MNYQLLLLLIAFYLPTTVSCSKKSSLLVIVPLNVITHWDRYLTEVNCGSVVTINELRLKQLFYRPKETNQFTLCWSWTIMLSRNWQFVNILAWLCLLTYLGERIFWKFIKKLPKKLNLLICKPLKCNLNRYTLKVLFKSSVVRSSLEYAAVCGRGSMFWTW